MGAEINESSDFIDRDDLVSYKGLFAAEAPGLKGRMKLCEELQEMDRKEYDVVRLEQADLRGVQGGDAKKNASALNMTYFGIAVGVAMLAFAIIRKSVLLIFFQVAILSYQFIYALPKALNPNTREETQKIRQIFDDRLSRLQTKIRNLDQRIPLTQDSQAQEQLRLARDYFSTKHNIYTSVRIKDFTPAHART